MKKLCSLLLGLALLMSITSLTYAVPDKQTTYMLQGIIRADDKINDYAFAIGEDTLPGDDVRRSVYNRVEQEHIAPIDWWGLDFFGSPVKTAAQALTSADVEAMTNCEFVSIDINGYDEKNGDEQAVFHFSNIYPLGLEFVAVVGSLKDGIEVRLANGEKIEAIDLYDWQALRAEPTDNGSDDITDDGIRVFFTADALKMVNEKDAVLALLCEIMPGTYAEEIITTPGTPSKTVDDITTIRVIDNNEILNLIISVVAPLDEQGQAECDRLSDFILKEHNAPIAYFGESICGNVETLLPGIDVDALEMNWYAGVIAHNYTYEHGEIVVDATFPTMYTDGCPLVAIAGVFNDDNTVVWTAQSAEAVAGSVRITFTQNVITRFEENTAILIILNEPK